MTALHTVSRGVCKTTKKVWFMSVKTEADIDNLTMLPWAKAAMIGTAWAFAATVANVVVWLIVAPSLTIESGSMLFLLVPPLVLLAIAGVVHRSGRVVIMTALITVALNTVAFVLLVVLAITVIHWRN
jgi:hypothetical protein